MKKALIYSLSLALLLSLTACHRAEADQQDTNQPEPAAVSTPADVSTPEPEKPAAPEQLSSKAGPSEITHDELLNVFQQEYDTSKDLYHSDTEETIQGELLAIQITVEGMGKALPSDYEAQYRGWRPSAAQQDAQENTQIPQNNTDTSTAPAKELDEMMRENTGMNKPDQELIDQGFVATQDPETGEWDYENPNQEEDNFTYTGPDPSQVFKTGKSTDKTPIDPWAGSDLTIGYGEDPGTGSGSSTPSQYTPGGIKEVGE